MYNLYHEVCSTDWYSRSCLDYRGSPTPAAPPSTIKLVEKMTAHVHDTIQYHFCILPQTQPTPIVRHHKWHNIPVWCWSIRTKLIILRSFFFDAIILAMIMETKQIAREAGDSVTHIWTRTRSNGPVRPMKLKLRITIWRPKSINCFWPFERWDRGKACISV